MDSKQKADELVEKFYEAACQMNFNESRGWFIDEEQSRTNATQCAIIAVGEIISQLENLCKPEYTSFFHGEMGSGITVDGYELKDFWNEVLSHLKTKL